MNATWECIIVGGGAAGLSAALVLGRARRRTLVLDAGGQSNRIAHGIGGLLGHDGRPPAQLYGDGRAELARYPAVTVRDASATDAEHDGDGFAVTLQDGTVERTRTVLLATGMDYRLPDLPGAEPLWGDSVFHCPFCHGWEHAGQPLGILGGGETAVHRAALLRAWSDDVTLLTDGPAGLDAEQAAELAARGVTLDERPVAGLESTPDSGRDKSRDEGATAGGRTLSAVRFADGTARPLGGLLLHVTLHQRTPLATQLGLDLAPATPVSAETIAVNPIGATSVPGVFAAGDASIAMPSVANAIAAGANAAAGVVHTLVVA